MNVVFVILTVYESLFRLMNNTAALQIFSIENTDVTFGNVNVVSWVN